MNVFRIIAAVILLGSMATFHPQAKPVGAAVSELLADGQYEQAHAILQNRMVEYRNAGSLDSLTNLPYYIGKVHLHLSDATRATRHAEQLVDQLDSLGATPRQLYTASMSLVYFFDEIGRIQRSYEVARKALEYARKSADTTPEETGYLEYSLGASALQMGNFDLSSKHFDEALKLYLAYPATDKQKLADAYNAMGAIMWFSTKLDSARFYYDKSLRTVDQMEVDVLQKRYLAAVTMANLALIQQAQGETEQAIRTLRQTLANYHEVIQHTGDESQRHKTVRFQWRSMANLASFYNDVGDYKRAFNLLKYVLESQQEELQPDDPELYKTGVKVGQSLMSLKEYQKAAEVLTHAIDAMMGSGGEDLYWKAVALFALAETAEQLDDIGAASAYYVESEEAFKNAQRGGYNKDWLHFLRKQGLFYARQGKERAAVEAALDAYQYVSRTAGNDNTLVYRSMVNLAEVYFHLGDYKQSLHYGELSTRHLEQRATSGNLLDSVQANLLKPTAILIRCNSSYHLGDKQDISFLKGLYAELHEALAIIEWQKSMFTAPENVSALIENNNSLFDFIKQIGLDLYKITGDTGYLHDVIGFHESSLYNKIRLRFNLRNTRFFDVPESVLQQEAALRSQLIAFSTGGTLGNKGGNRLEDGGQETLEDGGQVGLFSEKIEAWGLFMADLQASYPRYYNMRYGILSEPIADITSQLDDDMTVIRYFFVGDVLYASVITTTSAELFLLDYLSTATSDAWSMRNDLRPEELNIFHELYRQLWEPFAQRVVTQNVTIIPDGELFNLNFETLLTRPIAGPNEFAEASLLSKHIISYRFSLLMMPQEHSTGLEKNYTAFAPGFFDPMKEAYRRIATGEHAIDGTYLTLLAQPFTTHLVEKLTKRYNGKLFVGNRATAARFKANVHDSKILHIGTHAEANNISPELSRIIFAKEIAGEGMEGDNFLYAHELYGFDLSSNLTVLAACETGKPGYQAGEGMVSLSHGFKYAGSQSLLTALWQVDEETSALILEDFFTFLSRGLSKAEALQRAKLAYLEHADGRAAMPQYWAGLVLLGDPAPVELERRNGYFLWIAFAGGLVLLLGFGLLVRRNRGL